MCSNSKRGIDGTVSCHTTIILVLLTTDLPPISTAAVYQTQEKI